MSYCALAKVFALALLLLGLRWSTTHVQGNSDSNIPIPLAPLSQSGLPPDFRLGSGAAHVVAPAERDDPRTKL